MDSKESTLKKVIGFQMAVIGIVLFVPAFQYGWLHVFPKWVSVRGNPTWWQVFVITAVFHLAIGRGYAAYKHDTWMSRGAFSLMNSGLFWLILWCSK